MADNNAINNKSTILNVDPFSSSDSWIQFDINTTGEFRIGVDDNAAFPSIDAFKISQGSAFGTNDTFIMTAAGERTMPLQPAFYGYLSAQDSNVTGDGTTYTLGSGNTLTEFFDQNSDLSTDGIFTAPVTGRYYLSISVFFLGLTTSFTGQFFEIVTSNRTYTSAICNTGILKKGSNLIFQYASLCDMDDSDTATATFTVSGSTLTVDIQAQNTRTYFSGYLVC